MDAQDIKAEVQILAKPAVGDELGEIPIADRDDPYIGAAQGVRTDRPVVPLLQEAQKLALCGWRQSVDLVEQQGAALCGGNQPLASRVRVRVRALGVAKELGFEQLDGNRTAVHRHPGMRLSLREIVDRLRKQLLARTGFTENQHARVAASKERQAGDLLEKRRTVPQ